MFGPHTVEQDLNFAECYGIWLILWGVGGMIEDMGLEADCSQPYQTDALPLVSLMEAVLEPGAGVGKLALVAHVWPITITN